DTLDPGDVAAGGDHPALAPADDHRLVPQLRPVTLLHRGVEGVAVHVGDGEAGELLVRHHARRGAVRASAHRGLALPEAVAAERLHGTGSSGQSQAAPRTPEESPCTAWRIGVSKTSEKTCGAIAPGRRS